MFTPLYIIVVTLARKISENKWLNKKLNDYFQQEIHITFIVTEKYHSQMKEAQQVVAEKTSSLEAEAYKTKRLQVIISWILH